jgi:hypothetical protein
MVVNLADIVRRTNALSEITFHPQDLINYVEPHRLQGETEAEDDVMRAGDPDGALGLEAAARLPEPPRVEPEVVHEPHRPNRVTTLLALPGAFGR